MIYILYIVREENNKAPLVCLASFVELRSQALVGDVLVVYLQ